MHWPRKKTFLTLPVTSRPSNKEKIPENPMIAKLFTNYKFSDYKEQVIDLLDRVCTVSVRTVEII